MVLTAIQALLIIFPIFILIDYFNQEIKKFENFQITEIVQIPYYFYSRTLPIRCKCKSEFPEICILRMGLNVLNFRKTGQQKVCRNFRKCYSENYRLGYLSAYSILGILAAISSLETLPRNCNTIFPGNFREFLLSGRVEGTHHVNYCRYLFS